MPHERLRAPRPAPGPALDLTWFVRDAVEPPGLGFVVTIGFVMPAAAKVEFVQASEHR